MKTTNAYWNIQAGQNRAADYSTPLGDSLMDIEEALDHDEALRVSSSARPLLPRPLPRKVRRRLFRSALVFIAGALLGYLLGTPNNWSDPLRERWVEREVVLP